MNFLLNSEIELNFSKSVSRMKILVKTNSASLTPMNERYL